MFLFLFFSFHLIIGGPILDGINPYSFLSISWTAKSIFFLSISFVILDFLNFLVLYYCVAISCLLFACVLLPFIQLK